MAPPTPHHPVASPRASQAGVIVDPRQVRALVSPVRQEIVDAIHAAGPVTISRLAAILGRPADSLYFHTRTLERVGLLVRVGEAATGRRAGGVYDVCARPLRLHYDTSRPAVSRSIVAVSGSMVRLAHRDFTRAFRLKLVNPAGPERNTWSGRAKGWLSKEQLAEVNACWGRMMEIFRDAPPRPGTMLHAATFVMTPLKENTRAKAARTARCRKVAL